MRFLPHTVTSVGVALAALPLALGALATPGLTPQAIADQGQTALASPQPLPTAQINGVVWDQTIVGNVVYVVGEFDQARPAGSPDKQNESPRSNAMAYDITTGEMLDWAPQLNAQPMRSRRLLTAPPCISGGSSPRSMASPPPAWPRWTPPASTSR